MADKAKDDAQRSNLTSDTFLNFVEELDTLSEQADVTKKQHAASTAAIRLCRKRAIAAGIDLEVLDEALRDKQEDPDRRLEKLKIGSRYQSLLGMKTTLDLSKAVQADFQFEEPDQQTKERIQRRDALQDGLDAGKSGVPRAANPHQSGTVSWAAYDAGWLQGNGTRESLAVPDEPKKARGRPRKVQPEPATAPEAGEAVH